MASWGGMLIRASARSARARLRASSTSGEAGAPARHRLACWRGNVHFEALKEVVVGRPEARPQLGGLLFGQVAVHLAPGLLQLLELARGGFELVGVLQVFGLLNQVAVAVLHPRWPWPFYRTETPCGGRRTPGWRPGSGVSSSSVRALSTGPVLSQPWRRSFTFSLADTHSTLSRRASAS